MTHVLDLSGANEKLFFLRQLVTGSREYCRREKLRTGTKDYTDEDWENYWGRLEFLVSKFLLDAATSLRVLQDSLSKQHSFKHLKEMERDLGLEATTGVVIEGNFKLTLRESCNKVIHATAVSLEPVSSRSKTVPGRYSYWNGLCSLEGEHSAKRWHVRLNVYDWCDCVDNYFECMAGELEWR